VRRLALMAVSMLAVVSMAVSPALAHDWDGDGWDEDQGPWVDPFGGSPIGDSSVDWDVDWDDSDGEDINWWNADCVVEDVDWNGVVDEWEVELSCS
jgi:hypothetical protein